MAKIPTLKEVKERWAEENRAKFPEMIFTSHVRMDIEKLLSTIEDLQTEIEYLDARLETEDI